MYSDGWNIWTRSASCRRSTCPSWQRRSGRRVCWTSITPWCCMGAWWSGRRPLGTLGTTSSTISLISYRMKWCPSQRWNIISSGTISWGGTYFYDQEVVFMVECLYYLQWCRNLRMVWPVCIWHSYFSFVCIVRRLQPSLYVCMYVFTNVYAIYYSYKWMSIVSRAQMSRPSSLSMIVVPNHQFPGLALTHRDFRFNFCINNGSKSMPSRWSSVAH